jgi:hypothetical protein
MKFNKLATVLALASVGALSGCAYSVHEVYVSDFTPYAKMDQGEFVKGEAEQFVVLTARSRAFPHRFPQTLVSSRGPIAR